MPSIINSDNGVISGSSGLKTTGGNDGLLNIQTNGSTAMSINASQQVTFNNDVNLPNTFGFKNRIINGAMVIDQRNAGAAVTSSTYCPDRWRVEQTTDGAFSAQQVSDAPTGFVNSLKWTVTTADASLAATQYATVRQGIEGFNTADLMWGTANAATVTLSFWVKSSLTGTFGGVFGNAAFNRSYPFTYTISAANTWEQKTVTITGDTTGTWEKTNSAGIQLYFGLGAGSTYSGTAGAWTGSGLISATGAVNVMGTLNATWQITGVQLEKGSTATSFDYRPYGTELMLCQRYFQIYVAAGTNDTVSMGNAENTTRGYFLLSLPVSMRTAPACTLTATNFSMRGTTSFVACTSGSMGGTGGLSNSFIAGEFNCGSAHGAPAGGCVKLTANTTASTIQISSEL